MNDLSGQSLGRYHLIEKLGEGGMATVYKAYDTRLERDIALKVIRKEAFGQEAIDRLLKRFEREAKVMARLNHPNIVPIIDYGEFEGSPYLVMPYLSGGTLKQIDTPIPWQAAAKLLEPVASALAYAHEKGILHRDVKPSNILINEKKEPILTDFGIAKLLDVEERHTITGTGVGVGTPEYMAPEQGLGKEVDGRADVYALGVVLYELVTGKKPYTADTPMAIVYKHLTDPLPDPHLYKPDLPDTVEKMIFKALAKKPEDRYQSMGEFASALKSLEQGNSLPLAAILQTSALASEKPEAVATRDELDAAEELTIPAKPSQQHLPKPQKAPSTKKTRTLLIGIGTVAVIALLALAIGTEHGWFAFQRIPTAIPNITSLQTEGIVSDLGTSSALGVSKDEMNLIYVPAGDFLMGTPDDAGHSIEHPQHSVYLDAYWIDETEVTNAMYEKCVSANACTAPSNNSSATRSDYYGNSLYDNYPVIYVNWNQAQAYCLWAGQQLPTEAQWEKAARGTDGRTYPWGNQDPNLELGNFDDNLGDTTQVGSYPSGSSFYGALDMSGNVWEWVSGSYYSYSLFADDYYSGITGEESRLARGGSWLNDSDSIRSAYRITFRKDDSYNSLGFRCVQPASSK